MKSIIQHIIFVFSLLFIAIGVSQAQSLIDIKVDVVYLASDYLEGRETGKAGEEKAAEYLVNRFKEIGLQPKGDNKTYLQTFNFNYTSNPHSSTGEARKGKNVVGFIDNKAATTVIIGAHYDHIGRGSFGSRTPGNTDVYNGADDNASGTAALLYLAERLQQSKLKKHNYLFIAFSGEEMGLYGSKHYVKNPTIDFSKVSFMFNMDMVGRLEEDKSILINGAGTSPIWKQTFPKIKSPDLKITTSDSGVGASDHTSFYLANIPALHFFTGTHDDYHKPNDDSEFINFEGIQMVADWMFELLVELNGAGKIEFTKTKEESNRRAASFKVSLGVMPDYASDGNGMRIDVVLDDRPAQKAGLEDGDIIIKIGLTDVKDIYDYMEGLSKFEKGDATTVVIKRGEEILEKKVVF
ncbi:MAG: M20/M25/M40 family metallo-hydrolase [Bacteroidota bacterium]